MVGIKNDCHQYKYIAIAGILGSGKTTAAKLLQEKLGVQALEETVEENIFLANFYRDMPRWAFHSQLFYLTKKIRQALRIKEILRTSHVVQDSPLEQDVEVYARAQHILGHMSSEEYVLYKEILELYNPLLPSPDFTIVLEAPLDFITERIRARAREFEQNISQNYLTTLYNLQYEWLGRYPKNNILAIPINELDITENKKDQEVFLNLILDRITQQRP